MVFIFLVRFRFLSENQVVFFSHSGHHLKEECLRSQHLVHSLPMFIKFSRHLYQCKITASIKTYIHRLAFCHMDPLLVRNFVIINWILIYHVSLVSDNKSNRAEFIRVPPNASVMHVKELLSRQWCNGVFNFLCWTIFLFSTWKK